MAAPGAGGKKFIPINSVATSGGQIEVGMFVLFLFGIVGGYRMKG
jgi:hypothetical protein